jgi:hypothetical protein
VLAAVLVAVETALVELLELVVLALRIRGTLAVTEVVCMRAAVAALVRLVKTVLLLLALVMAGTVFLLR